MRKLAFQIAHDPHKLLDELMALPFLAPIVRPDGEREAAFLLSSDGQIVCLDVSDGLAPEQIAQIEQVVTAHRP